MVSQKRRLLKQVPDDNSYFIEKVQKLFPNMGREFITDSQPALVDEKQDTEVSSLQTLKKNRARTRRILGKTVQIGKIAIRTWSICG